MGEKHLRSLLKFIAYWKNEGYEKFFNPRAVMRVLPLETAADAFGTETLSLNDSVDKVVMAVWTIGAELEKEASEMMSSVGNLMTGFLLDVAGSIALYNMHTELITWIKENIAASDGKFINGEFYPGMGSMRQDLMERVVTLGETERMIGVSAKRQLPSPSEKITVLLYRPWGPRTQNRGQNGALPSVYGKEMPLLPARRLPHDDRRLPGRPRRYRQVTASSF